MILYEPDVKEGAGKDEDSVLSDGDIEKLTDAIEKLNQTLIEQKTEEVSTEEVTTEEASTEEVIIPEEEMPLQKKDMVNLVNTVESLNKSVDKLVQFQVDGQKEKQEEKERSLAKSQSDLVFLDETVDNHLYLTSQVENADINDVYTMTLSIRNVCLLAFLIFLVLFFFRACRTVLERALNR